MTSSSMLPVTATATALAIGLGLVDRTLHTKPQLARKISCLVWQAYHVLKRS